MLQFLAEAADLGVDAAVQAGCRTPSRQIEKLIAIEHALRTLDQSNQEIVFAGAERDRDSVVTKELAGAGVELPAVET